MNERLARMLDAGFGHPRGWLGRLGGAVMARANAPQEREAVRLAELRAGQQVVAVGPGAGVGLALAAAHVGPHGRVIGVEPSPVMRRMAADRCRALINEGVVTVTDGTAEHTGCPSDSADAAISVNNIMLWDRPAGFAELVRVLRPGGRLVISVHRHVLGVEPPVLADQAREAGLTGIELTVRAQRRNGHKVDLVATRP